MVARTLSLSMPQISLKNFINTETIRGSEFARATLLPFLLPSPQYSMTPASFNICSFLFRLFLRLNGFLLNLVMYTYRIASLRVLRIILCLLSTRRTCLGAMDSRAATCTSESFSEIYRSIIRLSSGTPSLYLSNSYSITAPLLIYEPGVGFEPTAPCLQNRSSNR